MQDRFIGVYHVYILRCADTSLYCGITTDLTRRVEEHNSKSQKAAKYTRRRSPVTLEYSEPCTSRALALRLEYLFKSWTKEQKETFLSGKETGSSLQAHAAKRKSPEIL